MDRESEIQGLKVSHPVMRPHAHLACSMCVIFLLSGCAGLSGPLAGTGDISGDRIERKADVVRSFDLKRERAQYEAALGRWRGGDTSGCQTILIELLERNPGHRDARLVLADAYLESDMIDAAGQNLEFLVKEHPHDAQVHHSFGLFLQMAGDPQRAAEHLSRASQLDPANVLYAQSCKLAGESG